jgi:hypothetical protein
LENESNNKDFSFLFDSKSPENLYYRWKVFSLLQNDSDRSWRTEPFEMINKGLIWNPPNPIDKLNQKQSILLPYLGNFDVKIPEKVAKNESNFKEQSLTLNRLTSLPKEKMEELLNLLSEISLKKYRL